MKLHGFQTNGGPQMRNNIRAYVFNKDCIGINDADDYYDNVGFHGVSVTAPSP